MFCERIRYAIVSYLTLRGNYFNTDSKYPKENSKANSAQIHILPKTKSKPNLCLMIYNYNVVLTHKVLARLSVVLGANVCTGVRTTNNAQIRFNQQRRQ